MQATHPTDPAAVAGEPPTHELHYARRPRRRRAGWILLLLLVAAACALWWWRKPLAAHAGLHYAQYQCANHEFAPGTAVASSGRLGEEVAAPRPACWTTYAALAVGKPISARTKLSSTVAFVHRLRSPSGAHDKIVAVDCYPLYLSSASVLQAFQPMTVAPADFWSLSSRPALTPGEFNGGYPTGERVEVFGGRADPNDSSRFSIEYAIEGEAGYLDGQLKDDGTVSLIVRPGSPDVMEVYSRRHAER